MASSRPGSRLGGVRRMCVLAAGVVSVAGCVGMPSNGPAVEFSAGPQSSAPAVNLIGSVPLAPQPGENPSQIVQGFLIAAASYPTYSAAQEYLTGPAVKAWKPGLAVNVYRDLTVPLSAVPVKAAPSASAQVSVDVTGTLQSSFNGSGQYISALNPGPASVRTDYNFTVAKIDGQWRITNPPNYRMLPVSDFPLFYKPQDLYFFDPQDEVLVPDSVFVPLGATVSQLLTDLVNSLTAGPKTPWLANAADTELPAGTNVQQQVTNDGSTVTVNLTFGKSVAPSPRGLELFAAQLVWTLTGSPTSPPNIQSVVLELNGRPWAPPSAPCQGGPTPGLDQTQAGYGCFDPYPSSPASFYYVDRGQSWARCGSEQLGLSSLIGPVAPVVDHNGVFGTQQCIFRDGVHEWTAGRAPVQPPSLPAVTMTAVSPDGQYLAIVTAGQGDLYVGKLSGQAAPFAKKPRLTGGGITALDWDRNDRLWVVQDGVIYRLPATGDAQLQETFNETVTDLAVAPDGVRIAFIAQPSGSSASELYLAAAGGGPPSSSGQLGSPTSHVAIRAFASIGTGLTHPASVAWYDADNLIVVNDAASGNTLAEVPVDGQQAQYLYVSPPGVTSITADGSQNVLVAGLSDGNLEVSTGLEGPWVPLGEPGRNPAYPG
ncbi:MAG TPA: LpqB family beta-propeller domain-containing protein [Streptosporangiaceae bacterium]|nr:LpqB family beta-propeller domain-containing protein [Streptosporangiaceae bacterium]